MEVKQEKQNSFLAYFKNLSKKDKIILSSTIIIVIIALGLRFLIIPEFEKYTNNLITLEDRKLEEARVKLLPIQNEKLEERNEQLKLEYNIAIDEISRTPAVAQIIHDLKEIISKSNIEIKSINFSSSDVSEEEIKLNSEIETDENGAVTEIERGIDSQEQEETEEINEEYKVKKQIINMSLIGKYENIISFIKAIENYSRISEVSSVSFSNSEDGLLIATLTANFYNLSYEESESYDFNDGNYGKENSFN